MTRLYSTASTALPRIERKELDERRDAELREMQVGAGERFELHGGGAERDAVALPESAPPAAAKARHDAGVARVRRGGHAVSRAPQRRR